MNTPRLPKYLTYLGIIPFVIALLIACYDQLNLVVYFDYKINFARFKSYALAHSYGAIIAAFLAGIQWGISLNQTPDRQYYLASNVLALLAWFSLFAFASFVGISTLICTFVLALIIDWHAYRAAVIPHWFCLLRKMVTTLVIISLMTLLALNR